MDIWSRGAKATVYEEDDGWPRPAGYIYYMGCATCGACSPPTADREAARRSALQHVTDVDHSAYEPTGYDDEDD